MIVIPKGASVEHDGQKFRVFTKPEYRNDRSSSSSGNAWARYLAGKFACLMADGMLGLEDFQTVSGSHSKV